MFFSADENPEKFTKINGDIPNEEGIQLNKNNGTKTTQRCRRCCPDGEASLVSVMNTSLNTHAKTFCAAAVAHDNYLPVTGPNLLILLAHADFHWVKT